MALLLSLQYQLQLKKLNKMKQTINFNTFFYNCKRALYALMILTVVLAIPVLSYMELSHVEEQEQTEVVKQDLAKNSSALSFSKL